MERNSKFVTKVEVIDPETNKTLTLSVYRHENGGVFGIDSEFVDKLEEEDELVIVDPFSSFLISDLVILGK